jgi:hypothetical protein
VKVDSSAALQHLSSIKGVRALRRNKSSAFEKDIDAFSSSDTEEGAPLNATGALLRLQDIDGTSLELTAFEKGELTLHLLQELQLSLLGGNFTKGQLEHLLKVVNQQEVRTEDPTLQGILEEITLRAKVELAKYRKKEEEKLLKSWCT